MSDYGFERSERIGGHPALDFVNTVQCWQSGRPGEEYLVDYAALARWHVVTGLLDARRLRPLEAGSRAARRKAWRQAIHLRDTLYRLFATVSAGRAAPREDLDRLQQVLAQTVSWRGMHAEGRQIVGHWDFEEAPPVAILGPVAWSAEELLKRGPLDRVKACPGDSCGWLFLDLSKNRSRSWCSMKSCGNAAKVRRFRARQ